jgi:hypothetical protein
VTDHLTSFFPAGRDRGVTAFGLATLLTARRRPAVKNTGRALFTPIGSMAYGYLDFNREGQA